MNSLYTLRCQEQFIFTAAMYCWLKLQKHALIIKDKDWVLNKVERIRKNILLNFIVIRLITKNKILQTIKLQKEK